MSKFPFDDNPDTRLHYWNPEIAVLAHVLTLRMMEEVERLLPLSSSDNLAGAQLDFLKDSLHAVRLLGHEAGLDDMTLEERAKAKADMIQRLTSK